MSKIRILLENLLNEYDKDDLTDNFWKAAQEYKDNNSRSINNQKNITVKELQPVQPEDLVYIKQVTINTETGEIEGTRWLANDAKPYGRVWNKTKAQKYSLSAAQRWLKTHPRYKYQNKYEIHYEIESVKKI